MTKEQMQELDEWLDLLDCELSASMNSTSHYNYYNWLDEQRKELAKFRESIK